MSFIALILWVLTALGGFVLLGTWLRKGGLRQQDTKATRFNSSVVFGHFLLAAGGLVVWILYLLLGAAVLAWIAVAALVLVAGLGASMFARWLPGRAHPMPAVGTAVEESAESHFPVLVVYAHGALAVATLVLVILATVGIG